MDLITGDTKKPVGGSVLDNIFNQQFRTFASGPTSRLQRRRNVQQRKERFRYMEREDESSKQNVVATSSKTDEDAYHQRADDPATEAPRLMDTLSDDTVGYVRKVYSTLGSTVALCGATAFATSVIPPLAAMAFPLGLASLVPGFWLIFFSNPEKDSQKKRLTLLGSFAALSGAGITPLLSYATAMSPMAVPISLGITASIFGAMTVAAGFMKKGGMMKWGAPLTGGCFVLLGCGVASMFIDWPILHSIWLYGGLGLFTAFIAYDTHVMIEDYENGREDLAGHSFGLFLDLFNIFKHVLLIFSSDD